MSKYHGNNMPGRQQPQPWSPPAPRQKKRHWLQRIGVLLVVLLLLASIAGYMSIRSEMQNYPQFGSSSPSWQVCAIEPRLYHWHVLITRVDKNGKVLASQSLLLMGEQVKLQAEVLNLLGTPSAYKLISIEGFYTHPRDEQNLSFPRNTISLDDSKTPFFSAANAQIWLAGLVNASLAQPIVLTKDGKTYVLSETQNGLQQIAGKNSPLLCGFTHLSA